MKPKSIKHQPAARVVVESLMKPVDQFMALESASGILLLLVTILTLFWANSQWHESYEHFIHLPISLSVAGYSLSYGLQHWVNDGLMVIFFFVVGLEIKREMILGELSTPKKAALPMFAALGGMMVPALIYAFFNVGGKGEHGWGIPMATDIAFAVGILTLMGRKVPFALKVFLLALAIVDDLGAVLVIALFYSGDLNFDALRLAVGGIAVVYFLKIAGVRSFIPYILLGVLVWFGVLKSGVHATVAGVLLGLLTPALPYQERRSLPSKFRSLMDDISKELEDDEKALVLAPDVNEKLNSLNYYVNSAKSPLDRLVHALHSWVSFLIMPIFALVNAGVYLGDTEFLTLMKEPVTLGVALGLFIGKPIGVVGFSLLFSKLNMAEIPKGVTWTHMICVGCLAGIGFTMALFIATLGVGSDALLLTEAKLGILVGSLISAIFGLGLLALQKDVTTGQ